MKQKTPHPTLNQLEATAICGNDITSSCLYVSALAILQAGQWAWAALLVVAGVLFLYRKIYAEVVGALPLNGGAYNALLNTTSKRMATLAACLTLLSYMATAVISASEAMHYVHHLWDQLPVIPATIGLLAVFMVLTIIGIGESARVAVGIFIFHITTLVVLLVTGAAFILTHGPAILVENFHLPIEGSLVRALFLGFSAAMLGISGFESSANFVEEQAPGVFPKTLRNMWFAVSFFNPVMAFLALGLIRIPAVPQYREALLAQMGVVSAGQWLGIVISIDAALVLSGAVLTSFIGVTGLIRRMTLDRCLPQFLLKTTQRGTSHRIIIAFFLLSVSVLLITRGELGALAGVYTISFLSVMALFGLGNILLKVRRAALPRPVRAGWLSVFLGIVAVLAALVGNILIEPLFFKYFLYYFIPTLIVVGAMLGRISILRGIAFFVRSISESIERTADSVGNRLATWITRINSQQFVFFTRGDSAASLNRAILYVLDNEHTNRIKVVTVFPSKDKVPERLKTDLKFLDETYPEVDINFVFEKGKFGPEKINELSDRWAIPKNFMFIGSPGTHFPYRLEELGGVRLII